MVATKQDRSGVFEASEPRPAHVATLARDVQLSPKGITFVSSEHLAEWTEVGVEIQLPSGDQAARGCQIDCRGVVVRCSRRPRGRGFDVALLFVDLPEAAHDQLVAATPATRPFSVSIAR